MIFPVVTIHGEGYLDGGLRSNLNAHLAWGADRVIVISCLPVDPPPGHPDLVPTASVDRADLAQLRARTRRVEVVEPGEEFFALASGPLAMMDLARAEDAFAAGVSQAERDAARVSEAWITR